jgi:hypothetical protein
MAPVIDNNDGTCAEGGDGRARSSATKTRGRGKAWLPEENLGVVLAACQLSDAAIDGATCDPSTTSKRCTTNLLRMLRRSRNFRISRSCGAAALGDRASNSGKR